MSLRSPVEEEPPHLRRAPVAQEPVDGDEVRDRRCADAQRKQKEGKQRLGFLVKWLGGSETWEPEEQLANAKEAIRPYCRRLKKEERGRLRNSPQVRGQLRRRERVQRGHGVSGPSPPDTVLKGGNGLRANEL